MVTELIKHPVYSLSKLTYLIYRIEQQDYLINIKLSPGVLFVNNVCLCM